jgi:hypothetical protein
MGALHGRRSAARDAARTWLARRLALALNGIAMGIGELCTARITESSSDDAALPQFSNSAIDLSVPE